MGRREHLKAMSLRIDTFREGVVGANIGVNLFGFHTNGCVVGLGAPTSDNFAPNHLDHIPMYIYRP